jgi:dipeptidyl aminopeptidase/acylaminoacyl peptidase
MNVVLPVHSIRRLVPAILLLTVAGLQVSAQQTVEEILAAESFLRPPEEIARVVLAPRHENVSLSNMSADGKYFLRTLSDGLPPMSVFAKPFYRLGGVQIDPAANRNRNNTTRTQVGFELIEWETGIRVKVDPPREARTSSPSWSPDGSMIAFFVHFEDATHIYTYDVASGRSRQLTPRRNPVMTTGVGSFDWTADGSKILTVLVPSDREDPPAPPEVPTSPMVRLTEEGENSLRVYASLLEDEYEKDLLEYYTTGQLALIDVRNRRVQNIGGSGMLQGLNMAPDGQYMRVTTRQRPFSYIVPVGNFGSVEEIWDADGNVLTELSARELRTGLSGSGPGGGDGGNNDKRSLSWRPDGSGLSFLQQEPRARPEEGEEPAEEEQAEEEEEEEPRKDRVMQWLAPFDSTSTAVIYESETRMNSVQYSEDCQVLFITEPVSGGGGQASAGGGRGRGGGGAGHLYAVYLDDPETKYTISNYNGRDFYENPGRIMTKRGPMGPSVVRISSDGNFVYLSGTQYSENWQEEAPRPFIDRVEIRTGEKERIWQSAEDVYETVQQVMDDDLNTLIISRQSRTMVPDSWLLNRQTEELRQLTNNVDHTPEITNCIRKRIRVTRADGIEFWMTITLPPGYQEGTRLPAMFWFYPREYTSQEQLEERSRTTNINTFPRVGTRSMQTLTVLGYAVIEPDCPIMGESGAMNDNYTGDLRNNLYAVIDALDDMEIINTDKLAIGGHSYGAFGTANALIQTPFFRAGIAGDGNYNRLLTPAGFQSERRELWQMREIYLRMSPLLWANELNGALLMYHGQHDQNTGTAPFHAPKMFHALNVLGKTASLYMYPYEDHGPATLETNLDLWARWVAWLDRYVMNYEKYEEEEKEEEGGRGRRGGDLW